MTNAYMFSLVLLLGMAAAISALWIRRRVSNAPSPQRRREDTAKEESPLLPEGADPVYLLAEAVRTIFKASAHPQDLLDHGPFEEGVKLLSSDRCSDDKLLGYCNGDNAIIACMALEALAHRPSGGDLEESILASINEFVA